jgi:D-lactate dehydrogenase (cytochrome)
VLIVQRALRLEGTCPGAHDIGLNKVGYLDDEPGAGVVEKQRQIKHMLGPMNILNPGTVFVV